MKKIVMVLLAMAALVANADEMARSEWLSQIGDAAQNSDVVKQVMPKLSAADQCEFLSKVNDAIVKMPGSPEARAAKHVAANKAAVMAAGKENRVAVIAEVFATVPPAVLPVLNEAFAEAFFKPADNSEASQAKLEAAAKTVIEAVVARCSSLEGGNARAAFAILSFSHAAELVSMPTESLVSSLVEMLPGDKETAKESWIAAASGEKADRSYEPILGVMSVSEAIITDLSSVAQIEPGQSLVSMLSELSNMNESQFTQDKSVTAHTAVGNAMGGGATATLGFSDVGVNRVPRPPVFDKYIPPHTKYNPGDTPIPNPYYRGNGRGEWKDNTTPVNPTPTPDPEPEPYRNQSTSSY